MMFLIFITFARHFWPTLFEDQFHSALEYPDYKKHKKYKRVIPGNTKLFLFLFLNL